MGASSSETPIGPSPTSESSAGESESGVAIGRVSPSSSDPELGDSPAPLVSVRASRASDFATPAELDSSVCPHETAGIATTAEPIPSATANAPTRPMCFSHAMTVLPLEPPRQRMGGTSGRESGNPLIRRVGAGITRPDVAQRICPTAAPWNTEPGPVSSWHSLQGAGQFRVAAASFLVVVGVGRGCTTTSRRVRRSALCRARPPVGVAWVVGPGRRWSGAGRRRR